MEFCFYFFPSSDMSLQAFFIFFSPTRQEYPCQDPSTVEYNVCALTIVGDNQTPSNDYPMEKFIPQLLVDPQKCMTYKTTLEFYKEAISWLITVIW